MPAPPSSGCPSAHGLADLARAVFESVAWEVSGASRPWPAGRPGGPAVAGWPWAGPGAAVPVWVEVLTGITGRPVPGRRSGQAASAGAALLAASAVGAGFDLDTMDPVSRRRLDRTRWSSDRYCRPAPGGRPGGRERCIGLAGSDPTRRGRRARPGHGPSVRLTRGLRHRRARLSRSPTTPWWSSPGSRRPWPTRPTPCAARCADPLSGTTVGRPGPGPTGPVAVVFPDLTRPDAQHHRAAAAAGRARSGPAPVPTGSSCCVPPAPTARPPPAEMTALVGARHRRPATASTTTTRTTVDHVRGGAGGRARPSSSTVATSSRRPPHRHRVRRAPLLRRLERGPEGRLPRPGRHPHHPGGPQPPPASPTPGPPGWCTSRRIPVHRVRHAPPPPSAPPPVGGRHHRQPAPADRGVRRDPARQPPGRLCLRRPPRWSSRWTVASTWCSPPTAGHPLDRNLYQAVKGMAAAERVVAAGGVIVMAAACGDGVPGAGAFARILRAAPTPAALVRPRWPRGGRRLAGPGPRPGPGPGRGVGLHSEGLTDDDGALGG